MIEKGSCCGAATARALDGTATLEFVSNELVDVVDWVVEFVVVTEGESVDVED
jgi:hypothetical protein